MVIIVVVIVGNDKEEVTNHVNALNFLPSQKPNLILNVDGLIGVAFVDMLRNCGSFTR